MHLGHFFTFDLRRPLDPVKQPDVHIGRDNGRQSKGNANAHKVPVLDLIPGLAQMPVMLAEAPMGVRLPPRVAPDRRPKYNTVGSTPMSSAIFCTTGSMVAT